GGTGRRAGRGGPWGRQCYRIGRAGSTCPRGGRQNPLPVKGGWWNTCVQPRPGDGTSPEGARGSESGVCWMLRAYAQWITRHAVLILVATGALPALGLARGGGFPPGGR